MRSDPGETDLGLSKLFDASPYLVCLSILDIIWNRVGVPMVSAAQCLSITTPHIVLNDFIRS